MKIDTFPRFFFGFWRHEKLPPFGKFRRPAEIFLFFCGDVTQAPHALCPNPPIPPYGAGAKIWAVGFLFCGKQPLNILEVVGLRAPTAVAECHRHSAKSRPSLRMERALRSGRWDSFSAEKPRRLKHATGMFLRAAFRIPPSKQKNNSHPNGWLLFWRRRWDSNPRGVLPPTRFRVELVMTTSILLRIAPVSQALIYSIMQWRKIQVFFPKS